MSETRREILRLVAILSDKCPNWRFGQLVVNIANLSANPPLPESVWDIEDEELLRGLRGHLERRFGSESLTNGTSAETAQAVLSS